MAGLHRCPRCGLEFEGGAVEVVDQLALVDVPQVESLPIEEEGDVPPTASDGAAPAAPDAPSPSSSTAHQALSLDVEHPKPPYRVPLMSEIRERPLNGLTVISTFSGCGGSCLGFRMAGFKHLMASEFVPAAQETYRANFPDTPLDTDDIRDLDPVALMERVGLTPGELDVLEGSPPCASFSTSGKREKGWGEVKKYSDLKQRTDDLFEFFIGLAAVLLPRVIVAENVTGLMMGEADNYRQWIEDSLRELGYGTAFRIVDASKLGVPQKRRRAILIACRRDTGLNPLDLYPDPLPYRYSVREAIGLREGSQVGYAGSGFVEASSPAKEPSPTITANGIGGMSNRGADAARMVEEPFDPLTDLPGIAEGTRLVHDTRGQQSMGERDLDQPIDTILAQPGGFFDLYEPEEIVGVSGSGHGYSEVVKSADEPVDTITSQPPGHAAQAGYVFVEGSVSETQGELVGAPAEDFPGLPDGGRIDVSFGPNNPKQGSEFDEPAPTIMAHGMGGAGHHQALVTGPGWEYEGDPADLEHEPESFAGRAIEGEWDKLAPGEGSDKYLNLVRPHPDEPLPTVTAAGGRAPGVAAVTHPFLKRKFTIPELRRLCAFPDDFVLTGTYRQQWERLGRAVPPLMMEAVARKIAAALLELDRQLDAAYEEV